MHNEKYYEYTHLSINSSKKPNIIHCDESLTKSRPIETAKTALKKKKKAAEESFVVLLNK